MKLDNRYELRVVVIEMKSDRTTGDCYNDMREFRDEHPFSFYRWGYIVYDTVAGLVPVSCNDWNDTPDEAYMDYVSNCLNKELTFPYVGIIYNWKGLKEENYLYTLTELQEFDAEFYEALIAHPTEVIDWDHGCACKTWMGFFINEEDSLREFLTGKINDIPVSPESDSYEELKQDWYWESVLRNDFYGKNSDTMSIAVKALGLNEEQLRGDFSEE